MPNREAHQKAKEKIKTEELQSFSMRIRRRKFAGNEPKIATERKNEAAKL